MKEGNIVKEFDLDHQFELYLNRVGIDKKKMHPIQLREFKMAFMGGCGQMLVLLTQTSPKIERIKSREFIIQKVNNMYSHISDFFFRSTGKMN